MKPLTIEDPGWLVASAIVLVIALMLWAFVEALPVTDHLYAETPKELRQTIKHCDEVLKGHARFSGDKENGWTVWCEYRD